MREDTAANLRLAALISFLILCFLGGGGSRPDVQSQLLVRVGAVLLAALTLALPGRFGWREVRVPLLLLGALAIVMLLQLVPLPPGLWTSLPGHELYVRAATAAEIEQPWRPISIAPILTINSLLALLPPAAVLITMAQLDEPRRALLLPVLIAGALLSTLLGIAQLTGDPGSGLYLYRITNPTAPVGLFANRNHQAVFLASALPMLAAWGLMRGFGPQNRRLRLALVSAAAALLFVLLMATGSRAGLAVGLLGLAAALLLVRRELAALFRRLGGRMRIAVLTLIPLFGIGAVLVMIEMSRAESLRRLMAGGEGVEELRFAYLDENLRLIASYMPFGSGFGTFDPAFRQIEPDDMLSLKFFNHAHSDPLEFAITGGLPAVVIAVLYLVWWGRRVAALRRSGREDSRTDLLAWAGAAVTALLLAGSLVDYPLRTPTLMVVFAIACAWMGSSRSVRAAREG